jgi:hypothetical protein
MPRAQGCARAASHADQSLFLVVINKGDARQGAHPLVKLPTLAFAQNKGLGDLMVLTTLIVKPVMKYCSFPVLDFNH